VIKVIDDLAVQGMSASSNATFGNGQRKLARESATKLHHVFESGTRSITEVPPMTEEAGKLRKESAGVG